MWRDIYEQFGHLNVDASALTHFRFVWTGIQKPEIQCQPITAEKNRSAVGGAMNLGSPSPDFYPKSEICTIPRPTVQ